MWGREEFSQRCAISLCAGMAFPAELIIAVTITVFSNLASETELSGMKGIYPAGYFEKVAAHDAEDRKE